MIKDNEKSTKNNILKGGLFIFITGLLYIIVTAVFTYFKAKELNLVFRADSIEEGFTPIFNFSSFLSDALLSSAYLTFSIFIIAMLIIIAIIYYVFNRDILGLKYLIISLFFLTVLACACMTFNDGISTFAYNTVTSVLTQSTCHHNNCTWITPGNTTAIKQKFNVKDGQCKFICVDCEKILEKGFAARVKGTKSAYDCSSVNSDSMLNTTTIYYAPATHKHIQCDKLDGNIAMEIHDFGPYKTYIGRYKHRIRRCKICGYEDSCCIKHTSIFQ